MGCRLRLSLRKEEGDTVTESDPGPRAKTAPFSDAPPRSPLPLITESSNAHRTILRSLIAVWTGLLHGPEYRSTVFSTVYKGTRI